MSDYNELVKELRGYRNEADIEFWWHITAKAADAIEELQQTVEHYKGCVDDWYSEACDYKARLEQAKNMVICEADHTIMFDERDKQILMEMAKSLPFHLVPIKNAEQEEKRTGRWFGTVCSACGESTSNYFDCEFCPHCGAEME